MKAKMTITIDVEVKKEIQKLAKRMWSNVSVLTNMFFVSAINTWNLHYYDFIDNTWEKLYNQYLESDKEEKEDAFSTCVDTDNKEEFYKNMNNKLWS